ncbi:hypothetical protein [Pedobacter sp. SYSU D00535]|uniref:hypothetical protein n=1 Tax=Pedobacter sp. SYSU D00535 TaxID=2810308 RepID=UPI001A973E10|nr:hypothetical protein [Pedobacter sp. SYSU D00535]
MCITRNIFIVFLLSAFTASAQSDVIISSTSKDVGVNFITQKAIKATEYNFPERIDDITVDSLRQTLLLTLRGIRNEKWLDNRGMGMLYDPIGKQLKWSKKLSFQTQSLAQYGGITIYSSAGKSYCLDNESGAPLWEIKSSLIFVDTKQNIGLGYKLSTKPKELNTVQGIDLSSGMVKWERTIGREYGWNDVLYLNDSSILVVAAGLHSINLKTGKGWDYSTITGEFDHTASAAGTVLGVAAGLLTGTYSVATGHNVIRDLVSNVLIEKEDIYFASKQTITKISKDGKLQWRTTLPEGSGSKSVIFKQGSSIGIINLGYGIIGNRRVSIGAPFIASYSTENGTELFVTPVGEGQKKYIKSYKQLNDHVILLFNDHVSRYSMKTGLILKKLAFDTKDLGELEYFIGNQVFVPQGDEFKSLVETAPDKTILFTKNGKLIAVDGDLGGSSEIDGKDLYIRYLRENGLSFIAKDRKTFVLDGQGKKVGELDLGRGSLFLQQRIYFLERSRLIEVDLADFLSRTTH